MKNTDPSASLTIPTVETQRLLLRPFAAGDLDDYTQQIFADVEVMRYLPKRHLPPPERAERTISILTERWAEYRFGVWAVTDKATGEFMGHCGLGPVPEAGEIEV